LSVPRRTIEDAFDAVFPYILLAQQVIWFSKQQVSSTEQYRGEVEIALCTLKEAAEGT
jgi:hypothetical protein